MLAVLNSMAQQNGRPFAHWSFDNNPYQDIVGKKQLVSLNRNCQPTFDKGVSGKALIAERGGDCRFQMNALHGNINDQFTISFYFRGAGFNFSSYPQSNVVVSLRYPNLRFRTTTADGQADEWLILLDGTGITSYDYLADGNWHQMVFTANARTGRKQIWIDGQTTDLYSRTTAKSSKFLTTRLDGFIQFDALDEVKFFASVVPPAKNQIPNRVHSSAEGNQINPKEFAPGHPNYSISLLKQLENFPAPRMIEKNNPGRLISWMDINYLHRETETPTDAGFGKQDPRRAVHLSKLMADKWNYYVELPLLFQPASEALKTYSDESTIPGALAGFARKNPAYPVSTILFQTSLQPRHIGLDGKGPFLTATDLPDHYYFRNESGKPVLWKNKKWLRPSVLPELATRDGAVAGYYLKNLVTAIGREPSLINENGEVFGHFRPLELLKQDPQVYKDFIASKLSVAGYSGRMQLEMDQAYKKAALEKSGIRNAVFSFYNLSAVQFEYWPDYAERRSLHKDSKGKVLSTPDFYPSRPGNWLTGAGALNGIKMLADGRKKEIELGDRSFSPFVSAGWSKEEENIRPAQWLALLKAMVMMGAEYFYVGYFNVTGSQGRWPSGKGPYNPAGYAYQVAMPAYAQAIRSWVPEFFESGTLLMPSDTEMGGAPFLFKGSAANDMILIRQLGKRYLIYGSIQPNSNRAGNAPAERLTSFRLNNRLLTLPIRKQGSVYLLDESDSAAVIYQLDGWHQVEHPAYWPATIQEDAANYSRATGTTRRVTNWNAQPKNKPFKTWVELRDRGDAVYYDQLPGEPGSYRIRLDYSLTSRAGATASIRVKLGDRSETIELKSGVQQLLPGIFQSRNGKDEPLSITLLSGKLSLHGISLEKLD